MQSGAVITGDYRYLLRREWDSSNTLDSRYNGGNLPSGSAPVSIPLRQALESLDVLLERRHAKLVRDAESFLSLLMLGNLFDTLLALDNQGVPPAGTSTGVSPATVLRNSLAGGFPSAEDC